MKRLIFILLLFILILSLSSAGILRGGSFDGDKAGVMTGYSDSSLSGGALALLGKGLAVTLLLISTSAILGCILGFAFCLIRMTGRKVAGAKDVAEECAAGSRRARMLFDEYGSRLADFISPVLMRFGADMLVLGGNISRAYGLFGPALENGMERNGCDVRVRTSALLGRAAMTGAASLFRAGD